MKKAIMSMFAVVAAVALNAATINQVIVRQQWPWSTKVKVEYSLSGVDASHPVDIAVSTYNGDDPLPSTNLKAAIEGNLYGVTEEFGEFYIDPVVAYGTEKIGMTKFKVKLTVSDSPANIGEVLYKIFDLTNGECTDVTRADLLNGKYGTVETDFGRIGEGYNTTLSDVIIWTGVTNNPTYKTTKLVMRKIPAAGKIWQIGSPTSEPGRGVSDSETQKYVRLSQDYYIGVFEFTQAQFANVVSGGSNPSSFTEDADAAFHPVDNVSYSSLRGNLTYLGPSGEKINWPTNSYLHEVVTESGRASFMKDLRARCRGVEFDLPFDPQWEFACRAGTYNKGLSDGLGLGSGAEESPRLDALGWYKANSGGKTHAVGLKRPNAFGLYDMHGNVREVLANWSGVVENGSSGTGSTDADPLVDPVGQVSTSGARTSRGGWYNAVPSYCRSAYRAARTDYYNKSPEQGFRVVCPVDSTWE